MRFIFQFWLYVAQRKNIFSFDSEKDKKKNLIKIFKTSFELAEDDSTFFKKTKSINWRKKKKFEKKKSCVCINLLNKMKIKEEENIDYLTIKYFLNLTE